ncbi:MAG: HEAT repeat domain-containing protein [Candidatus Aminicenantes bacterium]|nr:HEAT repeat domain-containing protein [Candidatus Aminicenantes bacterium]
MPNLKERSFSVEKNNSWDEVRDLVLLLTRTNSAFKIFPPEHATVKQFLADFWERLKSFLEKNGCLDLIIGENYFEYMGEKVFEDADVAHSLPFFFFRDGLQRLSFHRGLTEKELSLFFETIREVAFRPPDEADIVSAFWEKNFENITFYAPDEFIIEKITRGRPLPEYEVNFEELYSGKIELAEEDRKAIEDWQLKTESQEDSEKEKTIFLEESLADLKEEEWRMIESIIHSHRELPQDEELGRLSLEILYLEDRFDHLPSFKASLHEAHKALLKNGKLAKAAAFIRDLTSLNKIFASWQPQKSAVIESFLAEIEQDNYFALIKEIYFSSSGSLRKEDWLDYFLAIGRPGLIFLASLYQNSPQTTISSLDEIAKPILEKWAEEKPEDLMKLVQESNPYWSQMIIRTLALKQGPKITTFLAGFIRSSQPLLRREALDALARLDSPTAKKIILGYFHDEDEEIRVTAAKIIKIADDSMLDHVIKIASPLRLREKKEREIVAIFEMLASTIHPKVKKYFQEIFKLPWFLKPKNKKICLLAIEILKRYPNAQNRDLLKEIMVKGRRQLKKYCQQALKEINLKEII